MRRTVSADLDLTLSSGEARLAFMIAVARVPGLQIEEELRIELDGEPVEAHELASSHHGVVHDVRVADGPKDRPMTVRYRAQVDGDAHAPGASSDVDLETLAYLRPSRYAEGDRLGGTSAAQFRGLAGHELVSAVGEWVHEQLRYTPGASRPTDGAVETLLARKGVCRDYAHVVVALLRSRDIPARVSAVYAPGLSPMDFHAVAEAWVDGRWHVIDATRLAPRPSLLRIATGRDAADTAFLSNYGMYIALTGLRVMATCEELPLDKHDTPVQLP